MKTAVFSRQLIGCSMTFSVCSVCILAMLLTATSSSSDIETPCDPSEDYGFGGVDLSGLSHGDKQYLGLADGNKPILANIKSDLIIVEFMNVYCPSCKAQASMLNQLYSALEKDSTSRSKVKMVAIAVGNNQREVSEFRKTEQIVFPTLPDPKFAIYERLANSMRAPYTVLLKKGENGDVIIVSYHKGLIRSYESFMQEIKAAKQYDEDILRLRQGEKLADDIVEVTDLELSEEELMAKLRQAIIRSANDENMDLAIKAVSLPGNDEVFVGTVSSKNDHSRYFAIVVSRESICDICHAIQFIYVLDETGKIAGFEPIQLTKYENGNAIWNENDIDKMRQRVLGRSVLQPVNFDPEVDAVTAATITSAVIFHALSQGKGIFQSVVEQN